jgi:ATP-dependent helicase/nuclease subunit B
MLEDAGPELSSGGSSGDSTHGRPSVRWTRPGLDLVAAVSEAIRELQAGDPLRTVRVVAADGATVDGLRRALPRAGGASGAEIGGTMRLARAVAAEVLGERRPVPEVGVLAAVQRVLDDPRRRPAAFDQCRQHASTHDALTRSFASLDGLFTLAPPLQDAAFARLAHGRVSAGAVCQVVRAVRDDLSSLGWLDPAELLRLATDAVEQQGPQPPLVVVITQHVNPSHVGFLRSVAARSEHVVVVAAVAASPDGVVDAADTAEHVGAILGEEIARPGEVAREALRRVLALLDRGVPADRIAVLAPAAGPHRAALASMFAAAGVVTRGQITPKLAGSVAGQVLRALVACTIDGLDRRTLLEVARLAPFGMRVDTGSSDDDASDVRAGAIRRDADRWNQVSRTAGVVAEGDWVRLDDELREGHPDERPRAALRGFVGLQRAHRNEVGASRTWADAAAALERWFASHCGTVDWRVDHWPGVGTVQLAAAEQVEGVFARLAEIDAVGLPYRTSTMARLVEAFLDTDVVTTESRGTGVLLDQLVAAPGVVADHIVVVGANDGLVPGPVADDLVLTRDLGPEPFGVLTGPADRPRRDRRGLLAALDGAAESVTVTWARHDMRRGGAMYRSALLDEVVAARGLLHEVIASHRSRALDEQAPWIDDDEWYLRDLDRATPTLQRRRHAISARRRPEPGPYDGLIGPLGEFGDIDPLRSVIVRDDGEGGTVEHRKQLGITAIEEYVHCASLFFVKRVLGAFEDDVDPTELRDVEPREKGTLVHEVFECLVREWLAEHAPGSEPWVTEATLPQRLRRAEELLDELAAPALARRRLGHVEMWTARRAQLLRAIAVGLQREVGDRAAPIAAEAAFGDRGKAAPVVWSSPPFDVHFGGSIDRVDRMPDGTLRVMDIKSGRRDGFTDIAVDQPLGAEGDKLQLAFYGWAFEQVFGEEVAAALYRFTGRHDHPDDVGLALTPTVQATLHDRLHELVAQIADGQLPPGAVGDYPCPVCTPIGLGADEINRRVARWHALTESTDESAPVQEVLL